MIKLDKQEVREKEQLSFHHTDQNYTEESFRYLHVLISVNVYKLHYIYNINKAHPNIINE